VRVQEVRWDGGGTEPAREYTLFCGIEDESPELGGGIFIHKRITSAVKRVEFVSDRMQYVILGGRCVYKWSINPIIQSKNPCDSHKPQYVTIYCAYKNYSGEETIFMKIISYV
jgi:hypothetical protein